MDNVDLKDDFNLAEIISKLNMNKKIINDLNDDFDDYQNKIKIKEEKEFIEKLKYIDPVLSDSDKDEICSNNSNKKLNFDSDHDSNSNSDSNSDSDSESDLNSDSNLNLNLENENEDKNKNENENENEDENEDENKNENENKNEIPDFLLNEDVIGIDLGTTNTCVSIWKDGCSNIISDEFGNRLIPSCVAFTNKSRYVGSDAKNQKDINPCNVIYEVKRLIGRKIDDLYVKREQELLTYNLCKNELNDNISIKLDIRDKNENFKLITPEEISSAILLRAKQIASDYLKKKITKCVITVPAHFNDGQRQATKDSAQIAGLECIRIINEPTAAALAYGLLERTKNSRKKLKTIMVYDFGGGTLDVSILKIDNGIFSVLASNGNMRLGGSDFDSRLIEYCLSLFTKSNKDFALEKLSAFSLQKLRTSCEDAKQLLSNVTETYVAVKNFYNNKDLYYKITRDDFEKICRDLFFICLKPVDNILKQSSLSSDRIDEIILVGGMTRIPKLRELLKMKLGKEPNCTINPDEAVAAGAAIQGYILSHPDNPFSESITLLNTTALSLGIETIGGVMDPVVKRGESIPIIKRKIFTTDKDYVKNVKIKVFEGERSLTKDNFSVGEFILNGIEPQIRGLPQIEIMFNIDANSIITVTATNKQTKKKSSNFITSNKCRLNQNQINSLIEQSIEFEIKDEIEKKKKWTHFQINDMCSSILINISNAINNISISDKNAIKEDIKNTKLWLDEKNYDDRTDEEYNDIINSIKTKYSLLIMRTKNELTKLDAYNDGNVELTEIYDDKNENENFINEKNNFFTNLENEHLGFNGLSNPEKEEIKQLRNSIINLCNSILDITNDLNIKLSKNHSDELKDYADDTLLWLHIHEKITKNEYIDKINEINKNCDIIFENYNNSENNFCSEISKRDELEKLCYMIKCLIDDGALKLKKEILENLSKEIDLIIDKIYENDKNTQDNFDDFYENKIKYINDICNDIFDKNTNINDDHLFKNNMSSFTEKSELDNDDIDFEENASTSETNKGTSIFACLQRKQNDVINEMIINNNE